MRTPASKIFTALSLIIASTWAGSAQAIILKYRVSGDAHYTFQIDAARSPDFIDPVNNEVDYYDNAGNFGALSIADAYFFADSAGGGLVLSDFQGGTGPFLDAFGPQLFSGPLDNPTLIQGTFALSSNIDSGQFNLDVTAVPEPQSWILMIGGLGIAALLLRRRADRPEISAMI